MPFKPENRRYTIALIFSAAYAVVGVWAFVFLADRYPASIPAIGIFDGGIVSVLVGQVWLAAKTQSDIAKTHQSVEQGQWAAVDRSKSIREEIERLNKELAAASEMPKTPAELRIFVQNVMKEIAPEIVRQTVLELRKSGDLPSYPKGWSAESP